MPRLALALGVNIDLNSIRLLDNGKASQSAAGLKLSSEKIIVAFKTYQHHKIHDFKYVENAFIIEENKRQISTKIFVTVD